MKNLLLVIMFVLGLAFTFQSCNQANGTEGPKSIPETVAGKKALLKEKKQELATLSESIKELEKQIAKEDPTANVEKQRLVTTEAVQRQDFKTFVEVQGAVESDEVVMASSETGGRIIKLNTDEGKWVNKGAVIAETDGEAIYKGIAEVEKGLELARDVHQRQKNLWDQNIGSEIQYLQAKNNMEQLEKKLESTKFNLTKIKVYAPISGIVDVVHVKQGEMAGPGAPIVQIMRTSVVKVTADISEAYLKSVKKGAKVKIEFPSLEFAKMARISELGRSINPANRTLPVEVRLSNPKGMLKPNLLAVMHLNDYTAKDAVVIPTEQIQQDVTGKEYIFIKGKDAKNRPVAKKVMIESGKAYEGLSVVESGLKGGEMLIVEGSRSVADGELLKVLNEEKTAATPVKKDVPVKKGK